MAEAVVIFAATSNLLLGGAIEAMGAVQELESQAQASDYNAAVAEQNKVISKQQAQEDARRLEIEGRKVQGTISANLGASGINREGSAMDVLEESAANAELDRLSVIYAGDVKSQSYGAQAELDRFSARSARSQKFYGAAAPLIRGATSGAKMAAMGAK
jgi:hypothetical protein